MIDPCSSWAFAMKATARSRGIDHSLDDRSLLAHNGVDRPATSAVNRRPHATFELGYSGHCLASR